MNRALHLPLFAALFLLAITALIQELPNKPRPLWPKTSGSSGVAELESLHDFASHLLQDVKQFCAGLPCRVLVSNFLLSSGDTSSYGVALADELSEILASDGHGISVLDRSRLKELLVNDRIPARSVASDDAQRTLARYLGADIVLVGRTIHLSDDAVQLSARFLSVSDADRVGPTSELKFPSSTATQDLTARELYSPLPPLDTSQFAGTVYRLGDKRLSYPSCFYMPNPPYTADARSAKFSGNVVVEVVLDTDGKLKAERIQRGACCGLNEVTLQTLKTWKCKPGQMDGKPVATIVTFDVNFRLY